MYIQRFFRQLGSIFQYRKTKRNIDIEVDCSVLECEGEPCLFVNMQDEFAATCRLKNFGVAIAEPFSGNNPF